MPCCLVPLDWLLRHNRQRQERAASALSAVGFAFLSGNEVTIGRERQGRLSFAGDDRDSSLAARWLTETVSPQS